MTTATPTPTATRVEATTIVPGDAIIFLGTEYPVESVEPYIGPYESIVGVARSGPFWGMCLEVGAMVDVVRAS